VRGNVALAATRRALVVALAVAGLLFTAGCFSSSYVPVERRPWSGYAGVGAQVLSDNDARARVVRHDITLDGDLGRATVFVELSAVEPGARIIDARLAPAEREPCSYGFAAERVAGQPNGTPVAVRPGSELRVDFALPQFRPNIRGPSRVDLLVETTGWRRCLALTMTSEEPEAAWRSEGLLLSAGVAAYGHTAPTDGVVAAQVIPLSLGAWFGPYRASVGTGLQFGSCSPSICPKQANDDGEVVVKRSTFGVPLTLGLDAFAPHQGLYGAGLGVRYTFVGTLARAYAGRELTTFHGLSLVPRFLFCAPEPLGLGVPGGLRLGGFELEVPIGVVAPLDDPSRPALSLGLALLVTSPL
jgi:hypothetical protein